MNELLPLALFETTDLTESRPRQGAEKVLHLQKHRAQNISEEAPGKEGGCLCW